jgi:hypothetical protein
MTTPAVFTALATNSLSMFAKEQAAKLDGLETSWDKLVYGQVPCLFCVSPKRAIQNRQISL